VKFKKALYILDDVNISKSDKNNELLKLKNSKAESNYMSPA
jgi:hypothetical protein